MHLGIRALLITALGSATVPALVAAQTGASSATPRDSASTSALAQGALPAPSATSLALADTLLMVLHSEATMAAAHKARFDAIVKQQPAFATFRDVYDAWSAKYLRWADIGPRLATIYARAFTDDDLRAFIAFYRSPAGARLIDRLPDILNQTNEIGVELAAQHESELHAILMDRVKAQVDSAH